jgi:hypothetical protein
VTQFDCYRGWGGVEFFQKRQEEFCTMECKRNGANGSIKTTTSKALSLGNLQVAWLSSSGKGISRMKAVRNRFLYYG